MSKKITLLALAVAAVAMFALPAAASAQEIHWTNTAAFSGSFYYATLATEFEPTISCTNGHISGTPSAGGTTGSISFDFTTCTDSIFHASCHTAGSALSNTIATKGTYHLVTLPTSRPGILVTPVETTITCAGFFTTTMKGNLLGEITNPVCGGENYEMAMSFAATGPGQFDTIYTGGQYNLTSTTSGGTAKRSGLAAAGETLQSSRGKLECT